MVPPGSWSGNSNSGPTKQNGHSTTTRLGSADLGTPFSGIWAPEKAGLPADLKDEDPPGPIPADPVLDYAAVTRGQFLTFSSSGNTLKSNASDKAVRRGSKIKSISRSNSESSQVADGPDVTSSHYTFGLNPAVVVESNDDDPAPLDPPTGDAPKSRSSYASSIGYIDEEGRDKLSASTLDRKIFASKASSLFKPDSPPDLDKQNSWPRTLSSFMGGKEPLKFTSPSDRQVIPLQVRPSTPSSAQDSPSSLPPHHHLHHHHHHVVVDRYAMVPQPPLRSWQSSDVVPEESSLVPQPAPPDPQEVGSEGLESTFKIWERQGLVSPSEAMFVDSAASRL